MDESIREPVRIEMFYTLMCPNCRMLRNMLKEVLPGFGNQFKFSKTLASGPRGMVRTMKLGIHSVPTLLIDGRIVFRYVPSKNELLSELKNYLNNER